MKVHVFNIEDALMYGIEEAIILYNISFWIDKNKANVKHFYDGHYWTYNSYSAFSDLFPYLSESQIKRAILSLEKKGAIVSGCYNKSPYDKTKWYRLNNPTDSTKSSDGLFDCAKPIPYVSQDEETIIEQSIVRFDSFWDLYGKKVDTKKCKDKFCKLPEQTQQKILQVVELYVKKTPDLKFRKLPLTWLNGECWNDDYSDVKPLQTKNAKPEPSHFYTQAEYDKAIREWEATNNTSPLHDIQGHLL